MKGSHKQMVGLMIYVCLSALGLTLIKVGTGRNFTLKFDKAFIDIEINYILLIGMIIYILSFLTSMIVMRTMNLSVFYPLSAGLIYVVICFISAIALKEKISLNQFAGMSIILVGIIVMNLRK